MQLRVLPYYFHRCCWLAQYWASLADKVVTRPAQTATEKTNVNKLVTQIHAFNVCSKTDRELAYWLVFSARSKI